MGLNPSPMFGITIMNLDRKAYVNISRKAYISRNGMQSSIQLFSTVLKSYLKKPCQKYLLAESLVYKKKQS